jgi:hypothetical protein
VLIADGSRTSTKRILDPTGRNKQSTITSKRRIRSFIDQSTSREALRDLGWLPIGYNSPPVLSRDRLLAGRPDESDG